MLKEMKGEGLRLYIKLEEDEPISSSKKEMEVSRIDGGEDEKKTCVGKEYKGEEQGCNNMTDCITAIDCLSKAISNYRIKMFSSSYFNKYLL